MCSNTSSNNNNNEIFINLPHTILLQITNLLSDNLDRIVFTLVCKEWYEHRDKIILFKLADHISISQNITLEHFKLKSYGEVLKKSLKHKNKITYLVNLQDGSTKYYDYSIDLTKGQKLKDIRIPSDVTSVNLGEIDEPLDEIKSELESKENVDSLSLTMFCRRPIKVGTIPKNIKSLTTHDYIQLGGQLVKGMLPEGLETYIMTHRVLKPIQADAFPTTLKSLYFFQDLPLDSFPEGFKVSVPNLETIHASFNVAKFFIHNPKLHTIQLHPCDYPTTFISINLSTDIPQTITTLDFGRSEYKLEGVLPASVNYLNLGNCKYYLESADGVRLIPQNSSFNYLNLGYRRLDRIIEPGQLPSKIKILVINESNDYGPVPALKTPGCIPFGVEVLEIVAVSNMRSLNGLLPKSLHTLVLKFTSYADLDFQIPDSVETLKVISHKKPVYYKIPPSVKHFVLDNDHPYSLNNLQSNINSLTITRTMSYIRRLDSMNFIVLSDSSFKYLGGIFNVDKNFTF